MGINEFANYWKDIMREIKNCELTKEDSRWVWNRFELAKIMLQMSKPYGWYTFEIENRFQQLSSELQAALLVAESNYRKGYGKSKIEAVANSVKEVLKKLPSPFK